jgi:hypothetical protein
MTTSVQNDSSQAGAPAPAAESKCVFAGACNWLKTKECAGPALVCLATALISGYVLPLFVGAVSVVAGAASGYALKKSYCVLNDTGSKITHNDIARHVGSIGVAFFAPSLALYALTFNLFQFGNVIGRQFV